MNEQQTTYPSLGVYIEWPLDDRRMQFANSGTLTAFIYTAFRYPERIEIGTVTVHPA
jgi:hypothetical protein